MYENGPSDGTRDVDWADEMVSFVQDSFVNLDLEDALTYIARMCVAENFAEALKFLSEE